ncbi:YHS domain-containing protein [Desulfogranum mediterraneum]|uniref:YHS domain-containing protein n=1 Tax=Desulfogranum mediterraneum TaxID=160661 RepID=UPI00040FA42E|nr:YHS domain-containing protein [Desulfogranum mediterraneum]
MTPVRLVILAVLFYIGYRLLRSMLLQQLEKKSSAGKKESKVEDVLVEDPVCHTLIPKKQAVRLRRDGKTYYFCSEKCCDTFTDNPEGEL